MTFSAPPPSPRASAPRSNHPFPSPWHDLATQNMPNSHQAVLDWCQHLWYTDGNLRSALKRVIGYFLTEINVQAITGDGKQLSTTDIRDFKDKLNLDLRLTEVIAESWEEYFAYGNSFLSLLTPSLRVLRCPRCSSWWPIEEVASNRRIFNLKYNKGKFEATCVSGCRVGSGYRGPFEVMHMPREDDSDICFKRWKPQHIEIQPSLFTNRAKYYLMLDNELSQKIRACDPLELAECPWEIMQAVMANQPRFAFKDDAVFHLKDPLLAGISNGGWGIGRVMMSWRSQWHVQMLRCVNEAICTDFVVPSRIIMPDIRPGASTDGGMTLDSLMSSDIGDFTSIVMEALGSRRSDPAQWIALPFPVRGEILGGDAKNLVMPEMQQAALETLLNQNDVPMQFYIGNMEINVAAPAMRLFEASQYPMLQGAARFMQWLAYALHRRKSWPLLHLSLQKTKYADDFQQMMLYMQLAQSQWLSKDTAMAAVGIDAAVERRKVMEEAKEDIKMQNRIQEETESEAIGQAVSQGINPLAPVPPGGAPAGAAPPGGAPAGAAPAAGAMAAMPTNPSQPMSPEEIVAQAQQIADQLWLGDPSQRNSELRALKTKNEALHAAVKQALEDRDNEARRAGGQMVKDQQRQAAAGGAAPM